MERARAEMRKVLCVYGLGGWVGAGEGYVDEIQRLPRFLVHGNTF